MFLTPARRTRSGAYAVEFALLLPVWLTLVGGGLDVTWLLYRSSSLTTATTLACQTGALIDPGITGAALPTIEAAVTQGIEDELSLLELSTTNLTVTTTLQGTAPARYLQCNASQNIASLTGLILDQNTINRMATAHIQWQREAAP